MITDSTFLKSHGCLMSRYGAGIEDIEVAELRRKPEEPKKRPSPEDFARIEELMERVRRKGA